MTRTRHRWKRLTYAASSRAIGALMRHAGTMLIASLAAAVQLARADEHTESARYGFTQAGFAESAEAIVVGIVMPWAWQRPLASGGFVTGYWEASFGRWSSDVDDGSRANAWVTQLGVTPVLRWYPHRWGERGFVEAGIGANLLLPIYRSRDKRFSTSFNFGDHVALGWRFGTQRAHEVSLRLQHFSNAGIRKPNPGEDFLQLRWAWRY